VKKKSVKYIFSICIFGALVALSGCKEEPIIEVSENNDNTEQALRVYSELLSTYDIMEDFISSTDVFTKKDETLLPPEVIITIIDKDFYDGDGVEVVLDFGPLGDEPQGLLCKDKKYRAGKILLTANKPYEFPDAEISITFIENSPFYSGSGDNMIRIGGDLHVRRIGEQTVKMHCSALEIKDGDDEITVITDLLIEKTKDGGMGILNDEISINGKILLQGESGDITLSTLEPLIKEYTLECAQHVVEGQLDLQQSSSKSEVTIDFDPLMDRACDNKVSITINGKTLFYEY
jgi:hypothetical protein